MRGDGEGRPERALYRGTASGAPRRLGHASAAISLDQGGGGWAWGLPGWMALQSPRGLAGQDKAQRATLKVFCPGTQAWRVRAQPPLPPRPSAAPVWSTQTATPPSLGHWEGPTGDSRCLGSKGGSGENCPLCRSKPDSELTGADLSTQAGHPQPPRVPPAQAGQLMAS